MKFSRILEQASLKNYSRLSLFSQRHFGEFINCGSHLQSSILASIKHTLHEHQKVRETTSYDAHVSFIIIPNNETQIVEYQSKTYLKAPGPSSTPSTLYSSPSTFKFPSYKVSNPNFFNKRRANNKPVA